MAITEQERAEMRARQLDYAQLRAGKAEPAYPGRLAGEFFVTCTDCWRRLDCGTAPATWVKFTSAVERLRERGWHLCPGSRFRCPDCQRKQEQERQTRKAARRV